MANGTSFGRNGTRHNWSDNRVDTSVGMNDTPESAPFVQKLPLTHNGLRQTNRQNIQDTTETFRIPGTARTPLTSIPNRYASARQPQRRCFLRGMHPHEPDSSL